MCGCVQGYGQQVLDVWVWKVKTRSMERLHEGDKRRRRLYEVS